MALVPAASETADPAAPGAALAPTDLITVRRHLFPVPIRAPAWTAPDGTVVARLYRDEAESLARGAAATFTAAPPMWSAVPVRLADGPRRVRDSEMVELGFRATPPRGAGDDTRRGPVVGWLAVDAPPTPVLTVDEKAIFTAGDARYVLLAGGDGRRFARRPVEIGRVINGRAVVVAGLAEGDRVVRRRAFFLDAEQRAREASPGASPRP